MPDTDQGGPNENRPSSSPARADEPIRFLAIGQLQATHGVRGHFRVRILTDFPERFKGLHRVHLGEEYRPASVESVRFVHNSLLLKLHGIDSPEAGRPYLNQLVYVPVGEAMALEEDQYYWYQIIGLEAWTTDERYLGEVADIINTGSNDVYVVKGDGGEVLIPAIEDVVVAVDLERKRLVVEPMEGLL